MYIRWYLSRFSHNTTHVFDHFPSYDFFLGLAITHSLEKHKLLFFSSLFKFIFWIVMRSSLLGCVIHSVTKKKSVFVVESPCRMLVEIDWIDEFFSSPWNSLCAYYLMALKRNFEQFFLFSIYLSPKVHHLAWICEKKASKLMQCRERSRSQLWRIKSSCHSDDVAFFNFKSHICEGNNLAFVTRLDNTLTLPVNLSHECQNWVAHNSDIRRGEMKKFHDVSIAGECVKTCGEPDSNSKLILITFFTLLSLFFQFYPMMLWPFLAATNCSRDLTCTNWLAVNSKKS